MMTSKDVDHIQRMADRTGEIWGIVNGVPVKASSWPKALRAQGKLEYVAFPSMWKCQRKEHRNGTD